MQELLLELFLPCVLPVVYAVVFVLSVFFTNQNEDKFLVDKGIRLHNNKRINNNPKLKAVPILYNNNNSTLLVLIDFCLVLSELLIWSSVC